VGNYSNQHKARLTRLARAGGNVRLWAPFKYPRFPSKALSLSYFKAQLPDHPAEFQGLDLCHISQGDRKEPPPATSGAHLPPSLFSVPFYELGQF
jgi:hypothetical protein